MFSNNWIFEHSWNTQGSCGQCKLWPCIWTPSSECHHFSNALMVTKFFCHEFHNLFWLLKASLNGIQQKVVIHHSHTLEITILRKKIVGWVFVNQNCNYTVKILFNNFKKIIASSSHLNLSLFVSHFKGVTMIFEYSLIKIGYKVFKSQ